MIVRYPPLLPESQPFTSDALVENVDIAPTIADLLDFHWGADGLSLVPLISQSQSTIRDGALVEHCMAELYPCYSVKAVTSFNEIDTAQYAYIEYISNEQELYDLVADPSELNNLAYDPGHAGLKAQLSAQLAGLTAPPPTDTTIVTGALGAQHTRAFSFTYFSQSRFATYECRLDVNGVTGTWQECDQQPFVEGPLADGDYQFDVRGTDEYGVTDPTPDSQTFSIHETGPDVQITSAPPPDGHSGNVTFEFAGDPSVVRYECKLAPFGQNATWQSCTSPASYSGLSDNLWSFKVRGFNATDVATDPPAQWLFRVDNTGPTMRFLAKPDSPTRSRSATFEFIPDEATTGSYSCNLDSGSSTDCSSGTVTYNGLTEGTHSLAIHATDLLGDSKTTTYSWIVDLTPPVAQISSGPPPSWNHNYALFTLTSLTRQVTFTCTIDQNPTIACTRSPSFYQLADGDHTLTVTAFDKAGNGSAPVIWSWTQST